MRSKTGLHKKVAFIFDGSPASAAAPAQADRVPEAAKNQPEISSVGSQTAAESPPAPAQPATAKTSTHKTKKQTRKILGLTHKQGKTDPKQLKMLILVGGLSVVFIGVLFWALQSPAASPRKAAAAQNTSSDSQTASAPEKQPLIWTRPDPWPEQIRNPLAPAARGNTEQEVLSDFVVKGIVYSKTRPSAIIGDQIVYVGDTLNGITITAIEKDHVEFEQNGERWTQQVRR